MTVSIRIQAAIVTEDFYFDNDLGYIPNTKKLDEGYIFQSDKVSDEDCLNILEKCRNTWDDGNYIHGELVVPGIICGVFVWLDNPKLDDYPLLEKSSEYLNKLGLNNA